MLHSDCNSHPDPTDLQGKWPGSDLCLVETLVLSGSFSHDLLLDQHRLWKSIVCIWGRGWRWRVHKTCIPFLKHTKQGNTRWVLNRRTVFSNWAVRSPISGCWQSSLFCGVCLWTEWPLLLSHWVFMGPFICVFQCPGFFLREHWVHWIDVNSQWRV